MFLSTIFAASRPTKTTERGSTPPHHIFSCRACDVSEQKCGLRFGNNHRGPGFIDGEEVGPTVLTVW